MGKEALWVWELTFLNGQNLSRVKGFKPNNPLRGIMDRKQTSVPVFEKHESRIEKLVHRKCNKILLQK